MFRYEKFQKQRGRRVRVCFFGSVLKERQVRRDLWVWCGMAEIKIECFTSRFTVLLVKSGASSRRGFEVDPKS